MLCIVISAGIYHLYFTSNSSAIIVVPTPISRSVFVFPCILHCSDNLKYLKLRVPCGSFDGFRDDGDRGESGFVRLKARAQGMTAEIGWKRKLVTGRLVENNDHTSEAG